MGGRRLPVCLSVSDSVSEELLNQKVKSIKVCIHKAGGPQTYSAQRALGETGPSNGSPGPLTPLTQPWYPKTMFCRTMKRFMDQALTKSSSSTIYFCQIPSAWVCQKQFENIYQDCSLNGRSIESQWNAFKSKQNCASLHIASGKGCSLSVFDGSDLSVFKRFLSLINYHAQNHASD